ncbi:hypothetical protein PT2222_160115 [Paraburkholderia tropica]
MPASIRRQHMFDQLNPVRDRNRRAALQVCDTANVGRDDQLRLQRLEPIHLLIAQCVREARLRDRIGARGAAAQVTVHGQTHVEPERAQHVLHAAAQLLAVLQRAGRVVRHGMNAAPPRGREQLVLEWRQDLGQVAREFRNPPRLLRVDGVVAHQVRVFLDRRAAAGGVHHDRLHALLDMRPPGVDVRAHVVQGVVGVTHVQTDRAAAARLPGHHGFDAQRVEHARRGHVDVGHHRRLHATGEHQHLAGVFRGRPGERALAHRHLVAQPSRQQGAHLLGEAHGRRKQHAARQEARQKTPGQTLAQRARHALFGELAADFHEPAVLHARGAGRLATAAGEAAVEVRERAFRDRRAFHHLFHQIDAPARAVEFVAEQLVRRAGRGAEAAMHALAQDRVGFVAVGGVANEVREVRLHRRVMVRSEVGIQAAAIEDAGRVERGFQAAMDLHQWRGQGREHARAAVVLVPGAEHRGVAARLLGGDAHRLRVGFGNPPALRAAPFHQLRAGQLQRLGDRGQCETPERGIGRDGGEKRVGLLAQARPEAFGFHGVHHLAAERGARGLHGGFGARQTHGQRAVAPGAGRHRQRAAAPFVELAHGVGAVHVEAQRGFGLRHRQYLDREFEHEAERAERPRHEPRHVVARHVLHDLAAEVQHLAVAVHDHGAQHEVARRACRSTPGPGEARGNAAAERGLGAEVGRLERQHLAARRQCLFDLQQRRARARRDHQFGGIVGDDPAVRARVEHLAFERLAIPVFRAAAANTQRLAVGGRRANALGPARDDVLFFHVVHGAFVVVVRSIVLTRPVLTTRGRPAWRAFARVVDRGRDPARMTPRKAHALRMPSGPIRRAQPRASSHRPVWLPPRRLDEAAAARRAPASARGSETRQIGMRQQIAAHVHAAVFGAARARGDAFIGIEQARRVERVLYGMERITLLGRELHTHRIDLFDPHAVLARDRAAQFDAGFEDIGAKGLGAVPFVEIVAVEENQRVHVAVARVEHVDAAQPVLRLHFVDAREQRPNRAARHRAVHAVIVGRDAPGGGEGVFAARPEAQAFFLGARDLDTRRAMFAQHDGRARDFVGDFLGRAVGLAQQDRGCVEVVARLHEFLHGARGGFVHHFETGGNDAGRDDAGHGVAAFHHVVEARHDDLRGLRTRDQLDRHFGHDGEHAFAADHDCEQIEPRRVERERAKLHDLAVHRDRAHAQHVMHGEAVLEAVHAARVFGNIAADRAGDLRRRIGRVIETVRRGRLGNGQIAHARLYGGRACVRIDFENALEARERKHDAVADRHGAAGQARARAARHDRHVEASADLHDALDLRLGFRQCHRERQAPVGREAVALVGHGVFFPVQQAMRGQHRHQCLNHLALPLREGFGREFGHLRLGCVHVSSCSWGSPRAAAVAADATALAAAVSVVSVVSAAADLAGARLAARLALRRLQRVHQPASLRRPAENLAGIHQIMRIERMLDGAHGVDGIGAVLFHEEVHLVQPHAVLARAGAVHADRALHDAMVQAFGLVDFVGLVGVDQDRHVEVAVAHVAHDRAGQRRALQVGFGFRHAFGEARDWHADVGGHGAAAGFELQHREVGAVTRVPQAAAVFGARGPFEPFAAVLRRQFLHGLRLFGHARFGAVKLEEQRVLLAQAEVRMLVDCAHRERVDEFHACDRHAHLNRFDHGAHGFGHRGKRAYRRRHRFRLRIQAHGDFGDHAQRTFGAHEQAREVVARRRLARARAGLDHSAVREDGGQAQYVLAHRAVAHGVGARGPRRRHAADARIRARVDREEQAGVAQRFIELLARNAGLDGDGEVFGVDREHAVHLREVDRYAALHGQQMAFERGAVAVRNDGYVMARAQLDDGLHVFGALREDHGVGQLRVETRLVAAMMGAHGFGGRDALAESAAQGVEEFGGERAACESRRRGMIHAGVSFVGVADRADRPLCVWVVLTGAFHFTLNVRVRVCASVGARGRMLRCTTGSGGSHSPIYNEPRTCCRNPVDARRVRASTASTESTFWEKHDGQSPEQDRHAHRRRRHDGTRRRQPRQQGRRAYCGDRRRRRTQFADWRAAVRAAARRRARRARRDPARPVRSGRRTLHARPHDGDRHASGSPRRLARGLERHAAAAQGIHSARRLASRRARARVPHGLPPRGTGNRGARRVGRGDRGGAASLREPAFGSDVRAFTRAQPRGGRRRCVLASRPRRSTRRRILEQIG